jgi:hypothetical protein
MEIPETSNEYRRMEMLRAALPYIPVSMQKFLNIYISLEELFQAIRDIRNTAAMSYNASETGNQKQKDAGDLIKVLRGFCTPQENEMIDLFFRMSQMMEMYDNYKDMFAPVSDDFSSAPPQNNPFDMLKMVNQFKGSSEIDSIFQQFTST